MRIVSDHLHRTQLNHEQPFIVNKYPRHIQNTHIMAVKVTEGKEDSKEKKKRFKRQNKKKEQ